jgi:hypothetical protein
MNCYSFTEQVSSKEASAEFACSLSFTLFVFFLLIFSGYLLYKVTDIISPKWLTIMAKPKVVVLLPGDLNRNATFASNILSVLY